jgi:imidazolonepropionase-like amidohydrolase
MDRGWIPGFIAAHIHIQLDGHDLADCITADTDAGLAVVIKREGGRPVVNHLDEISTRVVRGAVDIRMPADFSAALLQWGRG